MKMKTHNYSRKRQAICELLMSTREHPSAQWLYNELKPEYPDLSLGTVYRNLKFLESSGVIRSVAVVDGIERYDGITEDHAHFVCNCCGRILDIPIPHDFDSIHSGLFESDKRLAGVGKIEFTKIIYYGNCDECIGKQSISESRE